MCCQCVANVRDAKMPQPNRSLASYAEGREKGYSKLKRGFWGDVVQSPYWAVCVFTANVLLMCC
jgi:hypothetical protein